MIVSFFKRGRGSPNAAPALSQAGPIGYVLGDIDANKQQRNVKPELLRGDPEVLAAIIDSGRHPGRYTSGVLSFSEAEIERGTLQELIDSFEGALLPGLEKDQYGALWALHRDKGRVELHFVVAGEELSTGKRLNAYYHRQDMPRINNWKDAINYEYGFSDPNDPSRKKTVKDAKDLPPNVAAFKDEINKHILNLVAVGDIKNRKDVVSELEDIGLTIKRETPNAISVGNPNGGKRNIKLEGDIYKRGFAADQLAPSQLEAARGRYTEGRERDAKRARAEYQKYHEQRAAANAERYKQPTEPAPKAPERHAEAPGGPGAEHREAAAEAPREPAEAAPGPGEAPSTDAVPHPARADAAKPVPGHGADVPNNKQLEDKENEPDEHRSNAIFEGLRSRIREARAGFAHAIKRTVSAFRDVARSVRASDEKLRDDERKIRSSHVESLSVDECIERLRARAGARKQLDKGYPGP